MKDKKKKKQEKLKSEEKKQKKSEKLPNEGETGKKKKKKQKAKEEADGQKQKAAEVTLPDGMTEKTKPEVQRVLVKSAAETDSQAAEGAVTPEEIFRALGDGMRLEILDLLKDQELCAAELLKSVRIVQSTLSHHMKILCESGVVTCRKQGRWSYYSINPEALKKASAYLEGYRKQRG